MGEEVRHRRQVEDVGFAMLYHILTLDKDLSDGAFRLYALLLKYAHQKKHALPGLNTLAKELGKTRVTVSRLMAELTEKGLITRQRRFGTSSITWIEDLNEVYKETLAQMDERNKNDTIVEGNENDTKEKDDCIKDDTSNVTEMLPKEEEAKNNKSKREEEKEVVSAFPETPAPSPDDADSSTKWDRYRQNNVIQAVRPNYPSPDGGGVDLEQGGDADGGRKAPPSGDNETGGRVGGKGERKETGDDDRGHIGHSTVRDTGVIAGDPSSTMGDHQSGIGDDFDAGTEKMWGHCQQTAAARAKVGNWADAGKDAADVAEVALARFCAMQGEAPNDDERESMLRELAETLKPLRVTVKEIDGAFDIMAKDFGYRIGNYNVFQDSFKRDLATCIRRARGRKQPDTDPNRHTRYDTPAVRASQAALEERRAARDPPAEDDATGKQIKSELQLQMSKGTFETWIKPAQFVCDDGVLVVTAADAFTRDWLENRVGLTIKRVAVGVVGKAVEVRFEVGR